MDGCLVRFALVTALLLQRDTIVRATLTKQSIHLETSLQSTLIMAGGLAAHVALPQKLPPDLQLRERD